MVEADSNGRLRAFRGKPSTPKWPVEQIEHFDFGSFLQIIQAALADESARRFVDDRPNAEAELLPMVDEIGDRPRRYARRFILWVWAARQVARDERICEDAPECG